MGPLRQLKVESTSAFATSTNFSAIFGGRVCAVGKSLCQAIICLACHVLSPQHAYVSRRRPRRFRLLRGAFSTPPPPLVSTQLFLSLWIPWTSTISIWTISRGVRRRTTPARTQSVTAAAVSLDVFFPGGLPRRTSLPARMPRSDGVGERLPGAQDRTEPGTLSASLEDLYRGLKSRRAEAQT